ncbi:Sec-independent protein translocase protein TatB [Aliidiomarina sp.]|uniref:Sec-independent protein translocase protein TatB n=1 Tax=Aliidiomarina sp. TaxID=1872439 RepID=UPI003A4D2FF6
MFDIGFWELLVVAAIGLFVLGPERLPGAIRSLQRTIAQVKSFGSKMEAELNHELRVKELHEHLKQIESAADMENLSPELKRSLQELENAAASVRTPYAAKDMDKAVAELEAEADGSSVSDGNATNTDTPAADTTAVEQTKPTHAATEKKDK